MPSIERIFEEEEITSPMPLKDALAVLQKAYEHFTDRKRNKRFAQAVKATIRALEVTRSKAAGWHPHYHTLLFVNADADLEDLQKFILSAWTGCVAAAGVSAGISAGGSWRLN